MMKRFVLVLVHTIAFASLSAGAAPAQGPGVPGGPPPGAPGPVGQILRGWLQVLPPPPVTSQLDLSSFQLTSIRNVLTNEQTSTKTASEEMQTLNDNGIALALSTSYTDSAASALAIKETTQAEVLVLAGQEAKSNILTSILTSAQRTTLATLEADAPTQTENGPTVAQVVTMMTKQLDLTTAQQTSITTLLTTALATQTADAKAVATIWTAYEKAHSTGVYEESAVEAAYTSAETTIEDYLLSDLKTQNAIWSLLTTTQKTEYEQMSSHAPGGPGGSGGPGSSGSGGPGFGGSGGPSAGGHGGPTVSINL